MLLNIGKTNPQCPKRLPGDEYTGESWLFGGEYTEESRFPYGGYNGESRLPCDEYTLRSRLVDLVYLEQSSEQEYIKTFWLQKDQAVKTPHYKNHRGVLTPWCILYSIFFCKPI